MTDRYNKLTIAIQNTKTSATTVAHNFIEQWVASYSIPSKLFTDKSPQFVSKFFVALCSTLGMNNITSTKYHPQTSGHAELFNSSLILRWCHYVSEYQTDWNTYQLLLMCDYNRQVHMSIRVATFSWTLPRTPQDLPPSY